MGVAILLVGGTAIVAVHAGWFAFSDRPSLDFAVVLLAMEVSFALWVWFFSAIRPERQLITIVAFVAAQAGFLQLLRLDGFTGDGRPIWTWRWQPTPQEVFERRRLTDRPTKTALPPTAVGLTRTSEVDFPSFRGRDRTGIVATSRLADDWAADPPRLLWKRPIGGGWSSFVVVADYCLTQEQRGEKEATVCYELRTGREVWAHYEQVRFYEPTSGEGPRATPTVHEGRVFSLGATGILNCLDCANGEAIWTVDILADNQLENRLFGVAGSPLVVGDKVIANPGGKGCSLAAYSVATGRRLWQAGDAGASYSSPQWAKLGGVEQVLDFNAEGLFAHELNSGQVLWQVPWISNPEERNNVCQPVAIPGATDNQPGSVFLASGYGMGCTLVDLQRQGGSFAPVTRWRNRNLKAKFSSVVVHNGYAYGLDDAILTCVKIATGERRWKAGRYGYGQLLLAGTRLIVQLESGEVALVEASPDAFRELGRIAALSNRTWNHPALAGRYLLVRNDREAACFELSISR